MQKELNYQIPWLGLAGELGCRGELPVLQTKLPCKATLLKAGNINENHRVQQSNFLIKKKKTTRSGRRKAREFSSPLHHDNKGGKSRKIEGKSRGKNAEVKSCENKSFKKNK